MATMEETFGPVIYGYSRAQAIEDGVLIDLSEHQDATRVFKYPVAFTSDLWDEIVRGQGKQERVRNGRIWDVCYMSTALGSDISPSRREFKVKVGARLLVLWADCGPGDDGAPVMTLGFPSDF